MHAVPLLDAQVGSKLISSIPDNTIQFTGNVSSNGTAQIASDAAQDGSQRRGRA
jgi:hypothetical protein